MLFLAVSAMCHQMLFILWSTMTALLFFFCRSHQACCACWLNSVWATISFNIKCKIDLYLQKGLTIVDNAFLFHSWTTLWVLEPINVITMQIQTWTTENTVGQNPEKWKYFSLYFKFQNSSGLITASIRVILVSSIP